MTTSPTVLKDVLRPPKMFTPLGLQVSITIKTFLSLGIPVTPGEKNQAAWLHLMAGDPLAYIPEVFNGIQVWTL